jgi:hypothetical protein
VSPITAPLPRVTGTAGMPAVAPPAAPVPARTSVDPLRGSFAEFARPSGPDLMARTAAIVPWIMARREAHVWPYARAVTSIPGPTTSAEGETPEVREGAELRDAGLPVARLPPVGPRSSVPRAPEVRVHSGGSAALQGRSDISRALEAEIGETLQMDHVTLFSSGWGAAFGAVTGSSARRPHRARPARPRLAPDRRRGGHAQHHADRARQHRRPRRALASIRPTDATTASSS